MCATNKVIVTVNAATPEGIVIYELLTPNGDSKNDEFVIANLDCTKDNELIIYNRWGNIVFEAQNYGCDNSGWWTGTLKTSDKPLPDGTYFYIFRVLDNHYERQGTIEINR
ncbi:MAG: gliding motility-associated C-terminal domain-containing protein [Sphingobacteriales bacterium]|nr:gliding motility-associated C-terminal domain-containing protein [Sphingobacteriales bacterium]